MKISESDETDLRRRGRRPERRFLSVEDAAPETRLNEHAASECPTLAYYSHAVPLPPSDGPSRSGWEVRMAAIRWKEKLAERGEIDPRTEGVAHEAYVIRDLLALDDHGVHTEYCHEVGDVETHMNDGVDLIVGDIKLSDGNHRVASPDALVRDRASSSRNRYWPVEIKMNDTSKDGDATSASDRPAFASDFNAPFPDAMYPTGRLQPQPSRLERALLQLAHYWRVLEEVDRAPVANGPLWAGVIGGPTGSPDGSRITWFDLADSTMFKQRPADLPVELWPGGGCSALERYDVEFQYRLHIATEALERMSDPSVEHPAPPRRHGACKSCHRRTDCGEYWAQTGDVRQIMSIAPSRVEALNAQGIHTVTELAQLDDETLEKLTTSKFSRESWQKFVRSARELLAT